LFNWIKLNSGIASSGSSSTTGFVDITGGNQVIEGTKTFNDGIHLSGYVNILASGRPLYDKYPTPENYFYLSNPNITQTGSFGGPSTQFVSDNAFCIWLAPGSVSNPGSPTGENGGKFIKSAFSVLSEGASILAAKQCFGVDASGMGYFRRGVILSERRYVPTGMAASGISGQMSWSGNYFYLCTGNNLWGRVAVAPW
jgi:hypothetical protein